LSVIPESWDFTVKTNINSYYSNKVVIPMGYSGRLKINDLEIFVIPHEKSPAGKDRIQFKNEDYLVVPNLYVACRSQEPVCYCL